MTAVDPPVPAARRTAARCTGCSVPIKPGPAWCRPCELRLPEELRTRLGAAEQQYRRAAEAAAGWLRAHPRISELELRMLHLAAQGLDNKQIAARMGRNWETVRGWWRNLAQRWGTGSRLATLAAAFRMGYLTVETHTEASR